MDTDTAIAVVIIVAGVMIIAAYFIFDRKSR